VKWATTRGSRNRSRSRTAAAACAHRRSSYWKARLAASTGARPASIADHGTASAPSGCAGCLLATTTPHTPPDRKFSTAAPLIPGLIVSEARSSHTAGDVPWVPR
jgi:hypothetical protein